MSDANVKDILNKIDCIGVDEKIHICLPWEDKTKCGIKVKMKVVKGPDYAKRFSCYECTY